MSTNDKAIELLRNIVANAVLQSDTSMQGATDCYAVPVDDIEEAREWLESLKP